MIVFKSLNVSEKIPVYHWSVTVDKAAHISITPPPPPPPPPQIKILYEALVTIRSYSLSFCLSHLSSSYPIPFPSSVLSSWVMDSLLLLCHPLLLLSIWSFFPWYGLWPCETFAFPFETFTILSSLMNPQRACVRGLQYSVCLSISHSVTQQKADLEDGSLPKIETSIKMLHSTF